MKKFKKTLACSVFALAQLGAVTIPMSLITTQQTCAVGRAIVKKVWPVVKDILKYEAVERAAKDAGVDIDAFFNKIEELLKKAGAKGTKAYERIMKMASEEAKKDYEYFGDYEFASDLP